MHYRELKTMDIAVLGYGVVGSGVAEVISLNEKKITDKLGGERINVKYILDLRKFPGDKNEDKIIDDFNSSWRNKHNVTIRKQTVNFISVVFRNCWSRFIIFRLN